MLSNGEQVNILVNTLKQELQALETTANNHIQALERAKQLRIQHEESLTKTRSDQAKCTQILKETTDISAETHMKHTFLQTSMQRLTAAKQEIQRKIASAYATNESLSKDVSRLASEKQEIEGNLSALEQILDSTFKVPKIPKNRPLMSQALEPMEDGCATCHGPLFGKLCKCAGCGAQMHWHCVSGGSYCHSCIG